MKKIIENILFAFFLFICASAFLVFVGFKIFIKTNPLFLALVSEFEIVNDSGQYIRVTPVGMIEGDGRYCPLGTFYQKLPSKKKLRNVYDVEMKAGEAIKIIYDSDDINFRHILIKTAFGGIYIMDTDKCGTLHSSCGAQREKYVIPDLSTLSLASSELYPLINDQCIKYSGAKEYDFDESARETCSIPFSDTVREKCDSHPQ